MGLLGDFYLNGANIASSTTIFTDADQTTFAPTAFYKDSSGYKYFDNATGLFGGLNQCGTCAQACNSDKFEPSGVGSYLGSFSTNNNVGAIAVVVGGPAGTNWTPLSPIGIDLTLATPSGQINHWNYFTLENNTQPGFVGKFNTAVPDTMSNFWSAQYSAACNEWVNAVVVLGEAVFEGVNGFVATGITQSWTNTANTNVEFPNTGQATGVMTTYIPNPVAGSQIVNIRYNIWCPSAAFSKVYFGCPTALPAILTGTDPKSTAQLACDAPVVGTSYWGVRGGGTSIPDLNDWLFEDQNAVTPRADGWWMVPATSNLTSTPLKPVRVENGIIVEEGICV